VSSCSVTVSTVGGGYELLQCDGVYSGLRLYCSVMVSTVMVASVGGGCTAE
jgi:hypothetical protein